jgi:uncharacterized membrane protein YkoI
MKTAWLFLALAAGTTSIQTLADDAISQAEIRRLVQERKIVPLETILEQYPENIHGRLLDLEVEREHGRIVYELEFLDPRGRVREYEIDAHDGRLLKQEFD